APTAQPVGQSSPTLEAVAPTASPAAATATAAPNPSLRLRFGERVWEATARDLGARFAPAALPGLGASLPTQAPVLAEPAGEATGVVALGWVFPVTMAARGVVGGSAAAVTTSEGALLPDARGQPSPPSPPRPRPAPTSCRRLISLRLGM